MNTYYIFKINKYFTYFYKRFPYKLYKLIEELYYAKDYDIKLSYKYYEQIANSFNKYSLNEYIIAKNRNKVDYKYIDNIHKLGNNKLVINRICLILKTNSLDNDFLLDIYNYDKNVFICDFKNMEYFFLDRLIKDRQKNNILV